LICGLESSAGGKEVSSLTQTEIREIVREAAKGGVGVRNQYSSHIKRQELSRDGWAGWAEAGHTPLIVKRSQHTNKEKSLWGGGNRRLLGKKGGGGGILDGRGK